MTSCTKKDQHSNRNIKVGIYKLDDVIAARIEVMHIWCGIYRTKNRLENRMESDNNNNGHVGHITLQDSIQCIFMTLVKKANCSASVITIKSNKKNQHLTVSLHISQD